MNALPRTAPHSTLVDWCQIYLQILILKVKCSLGPVFLPFESINLISKTRYHSGKFYLKMLIKACFKTERKLALAPSW